MRRNWKPAGTLFPLSLDGLEQLVVLLLFSVQSLLQIGKTKLHCLKKDTKYADY